MRPIPSLVPFREILVKRWLIMAYEVGAIQGDRVNAPRNNVSRLFSVAGMRVFALLGYFLRVFDFSFADFIIGFALGASLEINFRQTIVLSGDQPLALLQRPIVVTVLVLTLVSLRCTRRRRPAAQDRYVAAPGRTQAGPAIGTHAERLTGVNMTRRS